MIAYKLMREDCGGTWMYCGTDVQGVLNVLKTELESDMMEGNERSTIIIEPFEITQEEIDNMPEFPGW